MTRKFGTFCYLPPRSLPYADAFYANINHFQHEHELFLFSDHKWDGAHKIGNPEQVKHARDESGKAKPYAVSNALFLTALMMASQNKLTHMLYLEADCRVGGHGWDHRIFKDFEHFDPDAVSAGSVMVWNPCSSGLAAKQSFDMAMRKWGRRGFRMPEIFTEGSHATCAYANGCGSVIDVEWAVKSFGISDTVLTAMKIGPWDHEIGKRLWAEFGCAAYEKVAQLPSVFSTYGNGISTESERLSMLRDGSVAVVHQVKSNAAYP